MIALVDINARLLLYHRATVNRDMHVLFSIRDDKQVHMVRLASPGFPVMLVRVSERARSQSWSRMLLRFLV